MPRIAVTFSLQDVEEIERDCAVYRGRMERIAKHSAISREEQALRTERARQELINQVRESAAKTLESIRGRQVSQRLAEEAKKRERFEELKQHLEQEQEWRSAAKKKQHEDDFSFARELRDREKRLQALEEQLEQRARKELIAQYSRLSEEAARRERRALWRVQRMRLDEARAQFIMRDRQQIQAILEKYPLGQERPPMEIWAPVFPAKQAVPQPAPELSVQQPNTQESHVGSPPPNLSSSAITSLTVEPALISENIDINDFLPNSPNRDSQQVDVALQEIGSELPEACPTAQLVDYDFSAPFSPLEDITGQAPTQPRAHWGAAVQPSLIQNHPSFSHFPIGENMFLVQEKGPKASPFGHPSKSSFIPGQHIPGEPQNTSKTSVYTPLSQALLQPEDVSCSSTDRKQDIASMPEQETETRFSESKIDGKDDSKSVELTKEEGVVGTSTTTQEQGPNGGIEALTSFSHCSVGKPLEADTQDHTSDAPDVENISLNISNICGQVTNVHLMAEKVVSDVVAPQPSPSIHGHSSDTQMKIGQFVSEETAHLPLFSIHGHSSNSHPIKIGEEVSEVDAPLHVPSVHGHSSDSHIKVGVNVSEFIAPLPTPNVHGHASDAHIKVGELVSDIVAPLPSPSIHGHSSDANIKVGEFVSNVPEARPRWSKHGHASDSTLQPGCVVSGSELTLSPLPGSSYGHSSDSTLGIGCVVSGDEPKRSPLPGSAYGHSSDSNLGIGCIVSKMEPLRSPLPGSAFGHSSDSTLGIGCVVLGSQLQSSALPGSAYGHSSDSSLGIGCVVKSKGSRDEAKEESKGPNSESLGEQLLEGMGSWAASFSMSPGEKCEKEYLLALSSQYQVEHYEDCYNLMASSPECQLLKQVIRGPWGLPMDPTLRRATDTTAVQLSEMVSLPVLMKHSVTTPLITHVSLVNKAVVDYFFVELGVERHFEALRHFLLMEDGEFAQSLSDLLFEKLASGQTPGELLTPLVLNSILSKALQYSLHGDTPLASNFTFALRFLPETFHPHAPDSLNCLELCYKVDWPLNIIITDSCMNKYNRLFSFLLQLKHMVWSLRDVWFHLKRTALVKGAGRSVQFRQLQLYRHEMQHFVKVIQGYIANQILQVSWSEFTAKLAAASDLDAIHRTHADYLNRAIFRGLLTEKAAPVMNIIHSIFSLILKFRAQLIAQPWDSQQGEAVHPSFIAMQQSYNTFKYYSHFLFKVVTKLVNRGYQPHLEDFLLRINFNNYYKDS